MSTGVNYCDDKWFTLTHKRTSRTLRHDTVIGKSRIIIEIFKNLVLSEHKFAITLVFLTEVLMFHHLDPLLEKN